MENFWLKNRELTRFSLLSVMGHSNYVVLILHDIVSKYSQTILRSMGIRMCASRTVFSFNMFPCYSFIREKLVSLASNPQKEYDFVESSLLIFSLMRDLLHRGDRAMIYLFIAGSYTPWLTLKTYTPNSYAVELTWAIWILASMGILYQQMFHEKYKWLETTIYVTVALAPSLAVFEMVRIVQICHQRTHALKVCLLSRPRAQGFWNYKEEVSST